MIDEDAGLLQLLQQTRRIAVVGLSPQAQRPSHFVAKYLQERGYQIVPVNPACAEVFGLRCFPDLRSIEGPVDMVNVFRKSEEVPAIVADAIAIGARSLWLQLGVIAPASVARAEAAGLAVVMDRCIKIDHARLLGGLEPA